MTPQRRQRDAGLTLVEMLVALLLFALVGLASFTLIDTVIGTRDRTEGRLDAIAQIDRALILFTRDLGSSDPGSHVLAEGTLTFARPGIDGETVLGEIADPPLTYALRDNALIRTRGPDGLVQRLVPDLDGLGLRVLDRDGVWHDAWPDDAAEAPLAAVEVSLATQGGTVRRLVELPLPVPE